MMAAKKMKSPKSVPLGQCSECGALFHSYRAMSLSECPFCGTSRNPNFSAIAVPNSATEFAHRCCLRSWQGKNPLFTA